MTVILEEVIKIKRRDQCNICKTGHFLCSNFALNWHVAAFKFGGECSHRGRNIHIFERRSN